MTNRDYEETEANRRNQAHMQAWTEDAIEKCRADPEFMATGLCPVCVCHTPCLCDQAAIVSRMRAFYELHRPGLKNGYAPGTINSYPHSLPGVGGGAPLHLGTGRDHLDELLVRLYVIVEKGLDARKAGKEIDPPVTTAERVSWAAPTTPDAITEPRPENPPVFDSFDWTGETREPLLFRLGRWIAKQTTWTK